WGARAKHAVLMRISSHMLPQRATYFSDSPIRNHRCWPTPRPRRAVFALLKTRNRLRRRLPAILPDLYDFPQHLPALMPFDPYLLIVDDDMLAGTGARSSTLT